MQRAFNYLCWDIVLHLEKGSMVLHNRQNHGINDTYSTSPERPSGYALLHQKRMLPYSEMELTLFYQHLEHSGFSDFASQLKNVNMVEPCGIKQEAF